MSEFLKCPYCICIFFNYSDLQTHLNTFGTDKTQHLELLKQTHKEPIISPEFEPTLPIEWNDTQPKHKKKKITWKNKEQQQTIETIRNILLTEPNFNIAMNKIKTLTTNYNKSLPYTQWKQKLPYIKTIEEILYIYKIHHRIHKQKHQPSRTTSSQ